MDQVLAPIQAALTFMGIPPALFAPLVALGIINQFLKGKSKKYNEDTSIILAAFWSIALGTLSWLENKPTPVGGLTGIFALFAAALLVEFGLMDQLAKVFPWIPKNNEWVKPPADSVPPNSNP